MAPAIPIAQKEKNQIADARKLAHVGALLLVLVLAAWP